MTPSIDVTLPRDCKPKFPNKCILCEGLPTSTVKLANCRMHPLWVLLAPILHLVGWKRTAVPICSACKPRFLWQRWSRTVIAFGIVIVLVLLLLPYFEGWSRSGKKLAIAGLGLLGLLPYALFEICRPRVFDITANWKNTDYEFTSAKYAAEFRELNRSHLIAEEAGS